MKKQLITAGIVTTIGLAGVAGVGIASASTNPTQSNPMSSLVDAIASKFNLNKTDVQKVFDDQRTAKQAEQETKVKADLAKLVTDGKLTQAQVDTILAKRTSVQAERDAARSSTTTKTRAEMKTEMDGQRTALEAWAKTNNIPTDYLHFVMGGPRGGVRGGLGGSDKLDDATSKNS
ncbi:MAG: hypothetical protein ABIQ04_03845 [Candidatus Saccharimonadales bacterium]